MTLVADRAAVSAALAQRLRAVAPHLQDDATQQLPDDCDATNGVLLDRLARSLAADPTPARTWLLLTAVAGAYPLAADVDAALGVLRTTAPEDVAAWLLRHALGAVPFSRDRELQVVAGGVLVDVDHVARHDLHTGIQQVVRSTLPHWVREHGAVPVAWWGDAAGFRSLMPPESARVLSWGAPTGTRSTADAARPDGPLLVPWRSVVVLVDVGPRHHLARLAALARCGAVEVVGIGYDCIPVVSAEMVPWGGAGLFARYLEVVKAMRRIAAISASALEEFQGFADMLPAQGLTGPVVREVRLPDVAVAAEAPADGDSVSTADGPLVCAVGSYEPRKNHLGLLHAAEVLWREGHRFRLRLIGGMASDPGIAARIDALVAAGRPLDARHRVTDAVLREAYATARFTVFASLHEGYGLPVAESLAVGTPVITSDFGSTAEIAADGGALVVDPDDDDQLVDAMRRLLTDDDLLASLEAAALARPRRTWAEYAAQTWSFLVDAR